jgi:hypothetical protein
MPAQSDGTAAFHVPHHLPVAGQHSLSIFCAVLISLLLKNISQFYH